MFFINTVSEPCRYIIFIMRLIKLSALFCFLIFSIGGNAQTILPKSELTYKGWGNIAIASDGKKLTNDELRNILDAKLYSDYSEARRKFVRGRTLCFIGIPLAAYGGFCVLAPNTMAKLLSGSKEEMNENQKRGAKIGASIGGGLVLTASAVLLGIGIPQFFVGRHRIKNVVNDYNHQNGYEPTLSFGAQPHGIGFAYNF